LQLSRINAVNPEHFDDPVAAYDRLASYYADLSRRRELYLRGVEREIISRGPTGSRSLLDVGAGDGRRALRIASQLGIERVVLVEPSKGMAGTSADHAEVWPVRAEDLYPRCFANVRTAAPGGTIDRSLTNSGEDQEDRAHVPGTADGGRRHTIAERFDVITCLWSVLGHIPTAEKRLRALSAIARIVASNGRCFLDVNHRYNLRCYGFLPTSARWIHDFFFRQQTNGDVTAKWNVGDVSVSTYGHVFTHGEIMRLAGAAGLELEERAVIDYESGRTRRFSFQGNLLYIFRRSSRIDSSSAPQTS
jgi:SAM-dependent methyltransferase